jgi:hypothetical protein
MGQNRDSFQNRHASLSERMFPGLPLFEFDDLRREVQLAHRLDYIVGGANFLVDIGPSLF